jgi:uncharacterized protein with von Willebrand factor type A (vWA) domain
MTDDQFNEASRLRDRKYSLKRDLGLWQDQFHSASQLFRCGLDNVNSEIFDQFRDAQMADIYAELAKVDAEFAALSDGRSTSTPSKAERARMVVYADIAHALRRSAKGLGHLNDLTPRRRIRILHKICLRIARWVDKLSVTP